MSAKTLSGKTSKAMVALYETVQPMASGLYKEIQELAKKKPDLTLNANKVKIINRVLVDIREMIKEEAEIKYLDLLDDDILPQYSDVLLTLSQYIAALKAFHDRYYRYFPGTGHRWDTFD